MNTSGSVQSLATAGNQWRRQHRCSPILATAVEEMAAVSDEEQSAATLVAAHAEPTAAGGDQRRMQEKRLSRTKLLDMSQPPQKNIHGWQEQPKYLLGYWNVTSAEAVPVPIKEVSMLI